jgi:hypothetical protein
MVFSLENSQTFFGVLATIIILFIIKNKESNIILSILDEAKEKFNNQVDALKISVQKFDKKITQSQDYKLLNYYKASVVDKRAKDADNDNDGLFTKILEFFSEATITKNQYKAEYKSSAAIDKDMIDSISSSKESVLAPLYTLLFSLVIFIFDEIFKFDSNANNLYLMSVLYILVLFSYLFWFYLWGSFLNRFRKYDTNDDSPNELKFKSFLSKFWGKRLRSNLIRCLLLVVIVSLFCFLILFLAKRFMPTISINAIAILLLCITPSICLLGYMMFLFKRNKKEYSYLFMCGHFLVISIGSLIFAFMLCLIANVLDADTTILFTEQSISWLKFAIFFFVILNGIISPLSLPYLAYSLYYRAAKRKNKENNRAMDKLAEKMKHLASKIP